MTDDIEVVNEPLPVATWPDALPHSAEEYFLSIDSKTWGTSWSLHAKVDQGDGKSIYRPHTIWIARGALDVPASRDSLNAYTLTHFLPKVVHDVFYGPGLKTDEALAEWNAQKRIPALSVYVLPSGDGVAEGRAFRLLFRDVPCRLFQLTWKDFLPDQPHVEKLSLSSVASLKAIMFDALQGGKATMPPILYINTGDPTFTYMATGENGRVIGEAVSGGLDSHFETLQHMQEVQVSEEAKHSWESLVSNCERPLAQDGEKEGPSLSFFTRDRSTAILSGVLHTVYGTLLAAVRGWKRHWGASSTTADPRFMIWIDGHRAEMVQCLLKQQQPQHQMLIDNEEMKSLLPSENGMIMAKKALSHHGIEAVLRSHEQSKNSLVRSLEGQRVARKTTEQTVVHGTIITSVPATGEAFPFDAVYKVRYDDKVYETLRLTDLPDAFGLFTEDAREDLSKSDSEKNPLHEHLKRKVGDAQLVRHLVEKEIEKTIPAPVKRPRTNVEEDQPPTKKQATSKDQNERAELRKFVGLRVAKMFDDDVYFGTVAEFSPREENADGIDLWGIHYDDGDKEDFDREDLDYYLEFYKTKKDEDVS